MNSLLVLLLSLVVNVSNPTSEARENVPVVIPVPANAGEVHSVTVKEKPGIAWQLDDLDLDGQADELVFLLDLKPNASEQLTINFSSAEPKATFNPGTSAYIKLHDKNQKHPRVCAITFPGNADNRQMYNSIYGHGAVLEGLYSAVRIYMDNRQSVDLYAKHTPQLELETTGFYTTRDQLAKGYGRDILWAGTSVALASFRGWDGSNPTTIDSVRSREQRIIASGPLRSIVEVVDRGWVTPAGNKVDMTQRYTIYSGHRDYEVDVTLSEPANETFATGVQKLMTDNVGFITPEGLAGSWGSNLPDKGMPELTDTLGLGIYVAPAYLASTLEDDVNYLTLLRPDGKGHIKYSFISTALRDTTTPAADADSWFAYLRKWQSDKQNPVKVLVSSHGGGTKLKDAAVKRKSGEASDSEAPGTGPYNIE